MTRSILLSLLFSASLFAADPFPSERILIPLLTPPVHGAFGSEFHTKLRVYNHSENAVTLQGIAPPSPPALLGIGLRDEQRQAGDHHDHSAAVT